MILLMHDSSNKADVNVRNVIPRYIKKCERKWGDIKGNWNENGKRVGRRN